MEQAFVVYVDLMDAPTKVGQLWGHFRTGRESVLFEYDRSCLSYPQHTI